MDKLRIRINDRMVIELEGHDAKELVKKASFWDLIPSQCPVCRSSIYLTYRTPQDFEYYGLRCTGQPSHSINFGDYKDQNKGLFYKSGEEWKSFQQQQDDRYQGDMPDNFRQAAEQSARGLDPSQAPLNPSNDPVAKTLSDLITTRQLGMIRAIANEKQLEADRECEGLLGCKVSELSRRAASSLIDYLQSKGQQQQQPSPQPPVVPVDDDLAF